ncbi:hypothetical protein PHYSODRAFT_532523 [Phytophthora sojae]|uniref:Uncharacterized protein n=1 Tax=Phytophthora sojae (strain P6497) TaxID=1094619 RepID=G5AFC1_PHYSP|nr:hypothetical protein PHYSODRAFT_532523 [Phytophthora sojae]EGZ05911.1 hypothetical protein PHYSODRAFT_532523 [Phytophthora sojae]|eukprot:XP_009538772.1 hypothetical protein PHYSODRAFT_532523 [Phytophthora sojae]
MTWSGHVMKALLSGKRERPCFSDVFARIRRRNSTLPEPTDRLRFWINARSEARPSAYHMMDRSAAS